MIIDAHAHIFPDKIAKKATDAIGDFYGIQMTESAGTPDILLQEGRLPELRNLSFIRQQRRLNRLKISINISFRRQKPIPSSSDL